MNNNGYIEATTQTNSSMTVNLITKLVSTSTLELEGYGYAVVNTPLSMETSLKVV